MSTGTPTRASESPVASAEPALRLSLSLVMPGLNEEASVEGAVRRSLAALEKHADEFEIIVIDDGSTDGMGEIADRLAGENPRV